MSNKLQLTQAVLTGAANLKEMFELEPVRNNAIMNMIKTRGTNESDAAMHYEREKILFFKALQMNKKLEDCDRFSVYSAWIELHASGTTLNDGHAYIIPYGKQAQFQIGWKGRLDQIGQIPEVVNVPPAQVVHSKDDFDYELGERPRIIKHKPYKGEGDKGQLTHVYLIIQKKSGPETHLMTRDEVLNIRDRYSKGYIQYVNECTAAGKKIGDTFKKPMNGWDLTIEPPMWVSSEAEAWKKTLVKRAYKSQANKTARMKAVDERIKDHHDPEDFTGGERTETIDYAVVDEPTGTEAKEAEPTPVKQEEKKPATPPVDLGNVSDSF